MSKVLIVSEHLDGALNPSTAKTVACAAAMQPESIEVLVAAADASALAQSAAAIEGVTRVVTVENPANENLTAATLAPQVVAAARDGGYSHVLGPNTTFGKDLMPRVAALLGVLQVTDIMAVHGPYKFDRPIYAGNAIVTVEAPEGQVLVGTARGASFAEAGEQAACAVEPLSLDVELPTHTRFVGRETGSSDRPDLQTAPKVVSGGRGVGSKENFSVIYQLADKMGAAVGASRAAVDAGFVPNDMQVGQTGKIIAPQLYMAIGISGAIQHLAGIKDAGTIVAINSDPEAPIFEVADFGLVGDLFEVVPELEKAL